MLAEKRNIDQVFREKLADYEQTPPAFVWTNIKGKLSTRKKERRIAFFKTVGIAAAIAVAFLAGWLTTNPTENIAVLQKNAVEKPAINQNIEPSTEKRADPAIHKENTTIATNANTTGTAQKGINKKSLQFSSLASFAANTSFVDNSNLLKSQKSGELVLFKSEKDLLDHLQKNFKMVKKLTDWIAAVRKDSVPSAVKNPKTFTTVPFKQMTDIGSVTKGVNVPASKTDRWSLKAEFSPAFNSQNPNGGKDGLLYVGPGNYKPQDTRTENTVYGGMIAGYKVGKRFIIRSGVVYNNLRQTTRNVNFMSMNPQYNVPVGTALASTPVGNVSLNNTGNSNSSAAVNSDYSLSNGTKYYSASSELKQNLEFIEIPFLATYRLVDKKVVIGLTGGVSTNILVGNRAILSENGGKISGGETNNMRNVVYSGAVGLEMGYAINNRITLTVEPRVKRFINSLSSSKSVNYKPYQVGIVTGLSYSFN